MNDVFRIAQISDCHVSAAPDTLYRGQNPVENLRAVLDHVATRKPDILLATGDLSEDGSAASYETLAGMLAQPGVPVLAVPGNHDEPALLEEYFPGSPVGGVAVTDHGKWQIIRLDYCLPGKPYGRLDEKALQKFEIAYINFLTVTDKYPDTIWANDSNDRLKTISKYNEIYFKICENFEKEL